jgi:hypothetical protein
MAKDFKLKQVGSTFRTRMAEKASATVIEAGDLVALDTNLIVKAGAASTKLAYAINAGADGETSIEVTEGNDFTLTGTGDGVWSEDYRGDLAGISGTTDLLVDVTGASTNVIRLGVAEDAGVVDSTADIEFKIVLPIFE